MSRLAIIPARGGSKRIPRKNIKPFLGKPIIKYSIHAALQSGLFSTVMVSTDDQEIAEVAQNAGAEVPFLRSSKNADDYATTVDVILEVLNQYSSNNQYFTSACCIYPTAPFVTAELLQKGLERLENDAYDSVFPVLPFSFSIQRAVNINQQQRIELFQPQHLNSRSQDLESAYHDAGQFYWFKTKAIQEQKRLWTDNSGVVVLDEMEAQDIDNETDWKLAELKFQLKGLGVRSQESADVSDTFKPTVYFRADGNSKMGLGHVFRSLALAEMLSEEFDCQFIIRNPLPELRESILKICSKIIELDKGSDTSEVSDPLNEAQDIADNYLNQNSIIVLDGYHFTTDYQQVIKSSGAKTVCIDDIKSYYFLADAVINHAGGLTAQDYSTTDDTQLFLGLKYSLLRKPFREAAKSRNTQGEPKKLFVCLGGADPNNDTISVLEKCAAAADFTQIHLVLGGAYLHITALNDFLQQSNLNVTIHRNLNAEQMVSLMKQCGVAVTPPSTIAYEYLSVGGILFLKVIADNQLNINRYFLSEELAFSFEKDFPQVATEKANKALQKQAELLDGKMQQRYLNIFRQLQFSTTKNALTA
ncbi:MAG: pseudaminic acid cytidylyltransferase [Saprospiraceae bacterium]